MHFPQLPPQAPPATVISLGAPKEQSGTEVNGAGSTHAHPDVEKHKQLAIKAVVEEDEDPLRARVRLLVDSFLRQTWQHASQSIAVNGIDVSSLPPSQLPTCSNPDAASLKDPMNPNGDSIEEEKEGVHFTYSAFDPRLQKKVASLHGELEALTAQVSKLRREAPGKGAQNYQNALAEALQKDEEEWQAQLESRSSEDRQTHNVLNISELRKGWNEDAKEIFSRGVNELAALSGVAPAAASSIETSNGTSDPILQRKGTSLTETVGKAQRARGVAMEFE